MPDDNAIHMYPLGELSMYEFTRDFGAGLQKVTVYAPAFDIALHSDDAHGAARPAEARQAVRPQ